MKNKIENLKFQLKLKFTAANLGFLATALAVGLCAPGYALSLYLTG